MKCSVYAVWTLANDHSDVDARDRELRDRIIPGVRALPGFVQGVWARSADGTRAYNTIVFEDRDGADALIAHIQLNRPFSTAAGVHLHSVEIQNVVATS